VQLRPVVRVQTVRVLQAADRPDGCLVQGTQTKPSVRELPLARKEELRGTEETDRGVIVHCMWCYTELLHILTFNFETKLRVLGLLLSVRGTAPPPIW
jgi:hypothetical protein